MPLVLPDHPPPFVSHLVAPTRCVRAAFTVKVEGTAITGVTFTLDGRRRVAPGDGRRLKLDARALKRGPHRLVARVDGLDGRTEVHRRTIRRCARG